MSVRVLAGDCLELLPTLDGESVDACVTDPPYHLTSIVKRFGSATAAPPLDYEGGSGVYKRASAGFMGKVWDGGDIAFRPEVWREVFRILKPGGHLVAFGGSRTYHRLACAIEDAGFEIRDQIMWIYGSGFPKSLDVSKAIDKAAGAKGDYGAPKSEAHAAMLENGVARRGSKHEGWDRPWMDDPEAIANAQRQYLPATDAARKWQGYGTALKPAHEPIVLARKPLMLPSTNVVDVVETNLRRAGVKGEIHWTSEFVNGAGKVRSRTSSLSTGRRPAAEISAAHVGASETEKFEAPTELNFGDAGKNGQKKIQADPQNSAKPPIGDYESKSSKRMDPNANAAGNESAHSLHSTTLTEGEPNTGDLSEKSTKTFDAEASRQDIESFAGIATGLTGSLERVRINRLPNGLFVWPSNLPKKAGPIPLTVAANVLAHGTGALNIDGCRVETDEVIETSGETVTTACHVGYQRPNASMFNTGKPKERNGPAHTQGRWPANVILSYPEDEYMIRSDITENQKRELYRWLSENA